MDLNIKAKEIRKEIFKFKTRTGNGHLASCLSIVDVLVSLFYDPLVDFDYKKDKVIFSKAHGSPSIYPILADLNFIEKKELDNYCLPQGKLRLHSDSTINGCYFVGGSLGNGIGYASGRAYANKDSDIYLILGDAELYEGSVWESLLFISHHNLNNIKIIVDRNKMGILGETEKLMKLEPLDEKFSSFGFKTISFNGHSFDSMRDIFSNIPSDKPNVFIAETIKGKGISYMEGKYEYHTIIPNKKEDIDKGLVELS